MQIGRLGSSTEDIHQEAVHAIQEYMSKIGVKPVMDQMQPFWSSKNMRVKLSLIHLTEYACSAQKTSILERQHFVYRPLISLLNDSSRFVEFALSITWIQSY